MYGELKKCVEIFNYIQRKHSWEWSVYVHLYTFFFQISTNTVTYKCIDNYDLFFYGEREFERKLETIEIKEWMFELTWTTV